MDFVTSDALLLIGAVALVAAAVCGVSWLLDELAEPAARDTRGSAPVHRPTGDTGRHHVPEELLRSTTTRLGADLRARAKVRGSVVPPPS